MPDSGRPSGTAASPLTGDESEANGKAPAAGWVATEEHVRVFWRVVRSLFGSIVIDFDDRRDWEYQAKAKAEAWVREHGEGYHLERWEQRWWSTPAVWTRTETSDVAPARSPANGGPE